MIANRGKTTTRAARIHASRPAVEVPEHSEDEYSTAAPWEVDDCAAASDLDCRWPVGLVAEKSSAVGGQRTLF